MESPSAIFTPWAVFYTLTGTSAAALTGLTFVIITLIDGVERTRSVDGVTTFSTPIVVHFAAALMISGALCAPWPNADGPAVILAIVGLLGVSYQFRLIGFALNVANRRIYQPDLEDWMWYSILPIIAYAVMVEGAIALSISAPLAPYAPAAAVAMLILIGIHNSWDVVTYITVVQPTSREK